MMSKILLLLIILTMGIFLRVYRIDNVPPGLNPYKDELLVGDELAISYEQVQEHNLSPLFQIRGLDGKIKLIAYTTNPKAKCESGLKKGLSNPKCEVFLSL